MAANFDPYHVWLGIPRSEQPPHHYRLLGVGLFESDLDVIEGAADRQMSHVQKHKIGAHSADSQRLLNQLSAARITLLNPAKKADYDRTLRAKLEPQGPSPSPAAPQVETRSAAISPVLASPLAEQFDVVGRGHARASERTAPRKIRKPVKKAKIHPAVYALPVVLILGGVGGWLALRPTAPPSAAQAKAQPRRHNQGSVDKAGKTTKAHPVAVPAEAVTTQDRPVEFQPAKESQTARDRSPNERHPSTARPEGRPAAPTVVVERTISSPWLDMLDLIRTEQASAGSWTREAGSVRCVPPQDLPARLVLPVIPPKEYEIDAELTRNATEIDFGLASGSKHFVLVVDGWDNQATTGFQLVDGKPGNDEDLGAYAGVAIIPRKSVHVKIVVRETGVTLDCNGARVLNWTGGLERLGADASLSVLDPRQLFLAGRGEPFRFNRLQLRSLSGEPPTVLGSASGAGVAIVPSKPGGNVPNGAPPSMVGVNRPLESPGIVRKPAVPFKVLQDQGEYTNCATISPDGHWVMWATNRGANVLWDVRKGKLAGALDTRQQPIHKAAFTQDSRRLVTISYGSAFVWDMQTGQLLRSMSLPQTGQVVIGVSPDGRMMGSLESRDGAVSILDPLSGELLYRPEVPGNTCIGLSPGGKFAMISGFAPVAGGNNGVTPFSKLFDVQAKLEAPSGLDIQGAAQAVAFSGDASCMAVSDITASIKVWNLVKKRLQLTIRPPNNDGTITRLAFTPDGRRLLSGGPGSIVNLWNAETGERLADLPGHEKWVTDLQTTGDGRIGLTADGAGGVRLWRLDEPGGFVPPPQAANTVAPPDLPAQQTAAALIMDVYADDFAKAKKPADKAALADKLLNLSTTSRDMSEKYVLIVKARDLAREAGEPLVFLQAVGALGATFTVETYEMALTGMDALAKKNLSPKARQEIAEGLIPLAARAVEEGKFADARKLLGAAQVAARKSNDGALSKTIAARLAEIGDVQKQAEEVKAAEEAVAKNPDDPAANLALGKIYCLTKDDWSAGLPLLAKSSDDSFKALAVQEIAQPRDAAEQTKLADGWYALAEAATGKAKAKLLQHAAFWYRRAEPALSGLMQIKISKRLEEIAARQSADASDPATAGEKPAASNPATAAVPLAVRIKAALKKETYTSTRMLGATGSGKKFVELSPNGGVLIGFNYTADENNSGQITSMQAIYQVGRKVDVGAVWGRPRGTPDTIAAKKGYAVGALKVSGAFNVAGFEVTFMKIDRNMLDPQDKYASPWIGSNMEQTSAKSVGGDGQPAIGILGFADYRMYGLGLVQLPGQ